MKPEVDNPQFSIDELDLLQEAVFRWLEDNDTDPDDPEEEIDPDPEEQVMISSMRSLLAKLDTLLAPRSTTVCHTPMSPSI